MAIRKLTRKEVRDIQTWTETHWGTLKNERPTKKEICDRIGAALLIPLRPQSLVTCCEAAGLNLEEVTPPRTPKQLAAQLPQQPTPDNKLAAQLLAVVDELRRLAVWNGVKFDPENKIDRDWLIAEAAK